MPKLPCRAPMAAILTVLLLAGCDEQDAATPVEVVRAIKTVTITTPATLQVREISGVVESSTRTALSFEVAGRVKTVAINKGDKVSRGQVLATLDRTPYALNVQSAEADLRKARAVLRDKNEKFKQQSELFKKGFTTKTKFDQAESDLESAKSTLSSAQAKLDLARRDLSKTTLTAPFAGVIANREVDPFVEINGGKMVFELESARELKVAVLMPESLIGLIRIGDDVRVRFPSLNGLVIGGRISEVGSRATEANSFPVDVALVQANKRLRAGMTAAVEFEFQSGIAALTPNKDGVGKPAFLVPITAIGPGDGEARGHVFVYDPATSTVKKTPVRGRGVRGNRIEIYDGVKEGDIVAVAGVSFLTDGQKVTLYVPKR